MRGGYLPAQPTVVGALAVLRPNRTDVLGVPPMKEVTLVGRSRA